MHALFGAFAHRYDLHTPPHHYQHDHQLVLDLATEQGAGCRVLDVGCGTGVLLEKLISAGFEASGFDASPSMVAVAGSRVPRRLLRVQRMQELAEMRRYDLIVSLSCSIHYCTGEAELLDVLGRMWRALVPSGRILLQVVHGPNQHEEWMEDTESGPDGEPQDVSLRFRLRKASDSPSQMFADYAFTCASRHESFVESHDLAVTDCQVVARLLREAGFCNPVIWDSWKRDPLSQSGSTFVYAGRS